MLWHKNDQIISVGQTMFDKVKLGQLLMGSYTKNHQWSRQCSRTLICFVPARPAVSTGWRRLEVATTFSSSPPTSQTPASTGALCPPTTSEKLSTSCGYEVTDWRECPVSSPAAPLLSNFVCELQSGLIPDYYTRLSCPQPSHIG